MGSYNKLKRFALQSSSFHSKKIKISEFLTPYIHMHRKL